MSVIDRPLDTGTGYGRRQPTYLKELTEVGPGTPMGELLRRYWHPVGLIEDAGNTPKAVRVLGEDLVLFRDKAGRPGLVHARCAHRGTTLYYGKVEDRGIRCCYHGWLFDVEGRCLEQPCEPGLGAQHKDKIRQPWYPVQELYGLIFAYMGPPQRKPVLPRYEIFETLDEGEFIEADGNSVGGGGPIIIPCNWMQHYDNLPDAYHVPILHGSFSGVQFVEKMGLMPNVSWETSDKGVKTISIRALPTARCSIASARPCCRRCASFQIQGSAPISGSRRSAGCCRSTTRISASTPPAACAAKARSAACARASTASSGKS